MSEDELSGYDGSITDTVRALALRGLSKPEIVKRLGVGLDTVDNCIVSNGINVWRGKRLAESELSLKDLQAIRDIEELAGSLNVEQIAEELGIASNRVSKLAILGGIEVSREHTVHTKPHLDALIEQGASSNDLAEADRTTQQNVVKYLIRSGKYDRWKKQRGEVLKIKKSIVYPDLYNLLMRAAISLAAKEGWAASKAVEYFLLPRKQGRYALKDLVVLFSNYEQAQSNGGLASLAELGGHIGIFPSGVSNILSAVGLAPLYGSKDRTALTEWQKSAIALARNTSFSCSDAAYFIGVPNHVVTQRWIKCGRRDIVKPLYKVRKSLTRALASQIYEAADLEFNVAEITELFDTELRIVDYALSHRGEIAPKIIASLRNIFTEKTIDRPYL
ncbi:hypothetical protein HY486_03500 [Candidatus Woesearchaeota archaeon]|nr:hypothetical protein [Candidatus Woesearchaeota archaeon]